MKTTLLLRNHQRACRVNLRQLRQIIGAFLSQQLGTEPYELGIHLVSREKITWLNETYLNHAGSTDVITFDYREAEGNDSRLPHRPRNVPFMQQGSQCPCGTAPQWLQGDLFICVPEAVAQAAQFRSSWQSELVRYAVHGILHLSGYDDRTSRERHRMKREEDRWVRRLGSTFNFDSLAAPERAPAQKPRRHKPCPDHLII